SETGTRASAGDGNGRARIANRRAAGRGAAPPHDHMDPARGPAAGVCLMMALRMLAVAALLLLGGGAGIVAWIRWRRWRAEEQDTRLLTGIVDLRRTFRDGDLDA